MTRSATCGLGILATVCLLTVAMAPAACGGPMPGTRAAAEAPELQSPPDWMRRHIERCRIENATLTERIEWVVVTRRVATRLTEALRGQDGALPTGGCSCFVDYPEGSGRPGSSWCVAVIRGWFPDPVHGPARTMVLVVQSPLLMRYETHTFAGFPKLPPPAGKPHVWEF